MEGDMDRQSNVYYYSLTIEFYSDFDIEILKEKLNLEFLKKRVFISYADSLDEPKKSLMFYKRVIYDENMNYQKSFQDTFHSFVDDFKIIKDYIEKYNGQAFFTMFFKYNDDILGDRLIVSLSEEQMKILSENHIKFQLSSKTY